MRRVGTELDPLDRASLASQAPERQGDGTTLRSKPETVSVRSLGIPPEAGRKPTREEPYGRGREAFPGEPDLDPPERMQRRAGFLPIADLRERVPPGSESRPGEVVDLPGPLAPDEIPDIEHPLLFHDAAVQEDHVSHFHELGNPGKPEHRMEVEEHGGKVSDEERADRARNERSGPGLARDHHLLAADVPSSALPPVAKSADARAQAGSFQRFRLDREETRRVPARDFHEDGSQLRGQGGLQR